MKLGLRRRRPSDDAFIERLSESAFSEYAFDARERALRPRPGVVTLVAVLGDRPVGFAVISRRQTVAQLDAIAVAEQQRGRGVGRALLAAVEREAARAGAGSVELATADSNLAALDLFLAAGYRIVRTIARFYPRGQTAHVLAKRL
jgi:[ribosomal protein S18]-alanine N-acetyltransferase